MQDSTIIFEIGAIMLVAFIGALVASRLKQSVILGYIVAGALIGPFIYVEVGPFVYNGLVHESDLIDSISRLGLILLIFFVGLEFSVEKIKKVKGPAVILSLVDVGVNLSTGILLATALGWPLIDSIFLAAVLSMSCSAVAMKTLMELGRLNRPETQFMMGMIILEEFISMLFLTVVGGMVVKGEGTFDLGTMVLGMVAFFLFFVVMAVLVIPKTVSRIQKMKSDELFIVFMLGAICLSAALAELCGVPALIGAFFLGMTFAETKVMERMERKIVPLRDAFVAVFFVSFGMLIDLSMFGTVLGIILVAVVLILVDEILIMSAVAYLVGFPRRAAASVGASFSARGGESIMYATVGSQAAGATKGAELFPIAGAVTFVMSALCPLFIKRSTALADLMSRRLPRYVTYGGAVISRTLGKLVLPGGFHIARPSRRMIVLLAGYVTSVIAVTVTNGLEHVAAYGVATAVTVGVGIMLARQLREVVRKVDYSNLGFIPSKTSMIPRFVASFVTLGLLTCVTIAFTYFIYWPTIAVIAAAFLLWALNLMNWIYKRTCDAEKYVLIRGTAMSMPDVDQLAIREAPQFLYRKRWKDY